jgi:hypothetical protein
MQCIGTFTIAVETDAGGFAGCRDPFRDYGLTPSGDSFMLACAPPCKAVTQFDRATLRPYFGSPEALERGYADIRERQQLRESTQF